MENTEEASDREIRTALCSIIERFGKGEIDSDQFIDLLENSVSNFDFAANEINQQLQFAYDTPFRSYKLSDQEFPADLERCRLFLKSNIGRQRPKFSLRFVLGNFFRPSAPCWPFRDEAELKRAIQQ